MIIALHRRGCGTQQRYGIFHLRAHDGHIPSVIARCVFLLVARLLLFVDDNQPDVFKRSKDCGPRTDNDTRVTHSDTPPFARSFRIAHRGMQYRNAFETRAKPRAALPANPERQSDFWHEDDGSFPARERILHGAQIHFCLTASGDAVKQLRAKSAQFETRADRF